jgi:hypothetical protein
MKVHIVIQDRSMSEEILDCLQTKHGLTDVKQSRFERFGIVSGNISEEHLEQIRRIQGVTVTIDSQKKIV